MWYFIVQDQDLKSISNDKSDGEDGEVEVLRMVVKCFSKYDCINFDGNETEDNIHDGSWGCNG